MRYHCMKIGVHIAFGVEEIGKIQSVLIFLRAIE